MAQAAPASLIPEEASREDVFAKRLLHRLRCGGIDVGKDSSGYRGVVTRRDVEAGEALLVVPWQIALTVKSAASRLALFESKGIGITTRMPLERVLEIASGGDATLVTPGSGWALMMSMQLLAEMRDPRSLFQPYCATLPAPAGSRIAAVARGPAATDLLLFTEEELAELHCEGLAEAIRAERRRLALLHEALWGPPESDPAVSLESFVWAHALVSSRAIGLAPAEEADAGGTGGASAAGAPEAAGGARVTIQRCLLPGVDLCNHSGEPSGTLSWLQSASSGHPSVALVAKRRLAAGESVTLDYGSRWMRKWVQDYGFVVSECALELFEEVGAPLQALLVDSKDADSAAPLRLAEVRLLETGLRATACYIVRSASAEGSTASAPEVTVDEPGADMRALFPGRWGVRIAAAEPLAAQLGGGEDGVGGGGEDDGSDSDDSGDSSSDGRGSDGSGGGGECAVGGRRRRLRAWACNEGAPLLVSVMRGEREAELAGALADQCEEALHRAWPTTAEEDERTLSELRASAAAAAADDEGARREHALLAVQFRLARKLLLQRAATGLRLQSEIVGALAEASCLG